MKQKVWQQNLLASDGFTLSRPTDRPVKTTDCALLFYEGPFFVIDLFGLLYFNLWSVTLTRVLL